MGAAFGFRLIGAEKDVPLNAANAQGFGNLDQLFRHECNF
jgi:hypothetical protein